MECIQIAFIAVVNEYNHRRHWHLLMLGDSSVGKRLSDVSKLYWAKDWCKENCGKLIKPENGAKILPVKKVFGVSRYMAHNLVVGDNDKSDIVIYNRRLLKRYETKRKIFY
jgi:hypothetical protein